MRSKIAENGAINQCKTCTDKSPLKGLVKTNQLAVFRRKTQKFLLLFFSTLPLCLQSIFQLSVNGGTFKGNGEKAQISISLLISFTFELVYICKVHFAYEHWEQCVCVRVRVCRIPMFHFKLEHTHRGNDLPGL